MTTKVIKPIEFTLTQVKTKGEIKKSPGRPKMREEDKKKIVKPEKGTMRYERQKEQWKKASYRYYQKVKADRELAKSVKRMEKEQSAKKEGRMI